MEKTKNVEIYQCDGFMALRHRIDDLGRETACNLHPNQKQWNFGCIAWEHGKMRIEIDCSVCFPEDQ